MSISARQEEVIQSLVEKMVAFDASLSPEEQALFRTRLIETLGASLDVEGHALELRWSQGPQGLFHSWVIVDDTPERRELIYPSIWASADEAEETSEEIEPLPGTINTPA